MFFRKGQTAQFALMGVVAVFGPARAMHALGAIAAIRTCDHLRASVPLGE